MVLCNLRWLCGCRPSLPDVSTTAVVHDLPLKENNNNGVAHIDSNGNSKGNGNGISNGNGNGNSNGNIGNRVEIVINSDTLKSSTMTINSVTSGNSSGSETALPSLNLGPLENKHVSPKDFEFLRVIGKGSFGKVLLAKHRGEQKYYAVKVLSKKVVLRRDEARNIMAERHVLLQNVSSPFLVSLHYSFQSSTKLYFVLDYIQGGELFFHLQRERRFPEPRARLYAAETAAALAHLHAAGVVYRDLKPENLLLDAAGHVVLTDFGLSKQLAGPDGQTHTFCGTSEYLAPEILRNQGYDAAVDWWCLGAVLHEMLYGLPPFYHREPAEMHDRILNAPLKLKPGASPQAEDILHKLLAKQHSQRLGSPPGGFPDVQRHPFFASIDWPLLLRRGVRPEFDPAVSDPLDLHNIDPEFTSESVARSVVQSQAGSALPGHQDDAFAGFSYAPPPMQSPPTGDWLPPNTDE